MTSDQGEREHSRRRPELTLPRVLGVRARQASFEPPSHRNFDSALPRLEDTVEFVVETEGPIPVRALGPVLWVGDSPVTEVRSEDETHCVFVSLRPEELAEGASITFGWSGEAERLETGYTFTRPR